MVLPHLIQRLKLLKHKHETDQEFFDYDIGELAIIDLANRIENGLVLEDHYLAAYDQSDLFEYDDEIIVETSKLGIDILQQLSDNNGK